MYSGHDTEVDALNAIIMQYVRCKDTGEWPEFVSGPYTSGADFGHKVVLIVNGTEEQMIKMGKDLLPVMHLHWEPLYEIEEVWKPEIARAKKGETPIKM